MAEKETEEQSRSRRGNEQRDRRDRAQQSDSIASVESMDLGVSMKSPQLSEKPRARRQMFDVVENEEKPSRDRDRDRDQQRLNEKQKSPKYEESSVNVINREDFAESGSDASGMQSDNDVSEK